MRCIRIHSLTPVFPSCLCVFVRDISPVPSFPVFTFNLAPFLAFHSRESGYLILDTSQPHFGHTLDSKTETQRTACFTTEDTEDTEIKPVSELLREYPRQFADLYFLPLRLLRLCVKSFPVFMFFQFSIFNCSSTPTL